jgi:hypothetical protein
MENTQNLNDAAAGLIKPGTPAQPVGAPVVPAAPVVIDTPLLKQTYGTVPLNEIKLSSFTDVQAFAKDHIGIEIKGVNDFVPLFDDYKKAKEVALQATETEKTLEGLKSTLSNLPSEVSLILNAAIQGGDYKAVIGSLQKKSVMDYTKPFESQDPIKVINHYTGKQYNKEAFDALDPASREALTDSVKMKFTADQTEVTTFESNTKKSLDEKQNKFLASIDSSIATMLKANPTMDPKLAQAIKNDMLYGVSDMLFTKEKTYVSDAAEKIAMMRYGKQTIMTQAQSIGDLVKKMTNSSVSEATEKLLMKSDVPQVQAGSRDKNYIASIVERETSWLPGRKK